MMGWFGFFGKKGGAGGWSSGLVLLLYSCLSFLLPAADGGPSHCVQFGQACPYPGFTIGAETFYPRDTGNMYRSVPDGADHSYGPIDEEGGGRYHLTCPAGWEFRPQKMIDAEPYYFPATTDNCPKDVEVRPYLVSQNGRVLNGWVQVEVEYTGNEGPGDGMEFAFVQVRDEYLNAIGEFVSDPDEQCTTDRKDLIKPSKYMYLPCSAIGLREAKDSQGIVVMSPNQYRGKDQQRDLGPTPLKKGFQFTWRLNEYWCNRHQRIKFDVYVWTSERSKLWRASGSDQGKCRDYVRSLRKGDCRMRRQNSGWLYHKWIGAADIKIPGSLTCDTRVMGQDYKLTPAAQASWLYKAAPFKFGEDYFAKDHSSGVPLYMKICQVWPFPGKGFDDPDNVNALSFGGRCMSHTEKTVSHNFLPQCVINVDSTTRGFEKEAVDFSKFSKYTEYREHVVATRKQICEQECIYPTSADVPDIKKFKSDIANLTLRKPPVSFTTVRTARVRDRFETSWQTRKYHGNLFIFVTMFLIPVSIFFVRYFKETCMNQMSGGCAYWYWFHLLMSCIVPTLYYSGHASMHTNLDNFGYSKSPHGELHVLVGRIFIWLYMAMVALGAVRPAPRRALLVCNTLHSIIGFLLYFMCIFLVINSTFIPASPTVHECDEVTGLPIGYSFTARMVSGWFAFDMICHILLTVAQVVIDRQEKIKRSGCGLPIMPMLPGDHPHDLVGHRFRKLIFGIYVIVSVIFTIVLITVLFNRDDYPEYCVMGEMTCNLNEFRPNHNSSPFGCAKTSLEYYNKVYEKYEINLTEVLSSAAG